ncbi:hypothetical protein [Nocardia sp. NPDC020380]|uniref:hypothetical protein n=1 Tax=Nocardia sp. NPDC020380 TaxID=3364309 RepID=UPI0037A4ADAF
MTIYVPAQQRADDSASPPSTSSPSTAGTAPGSGLGGGGHDGRAFTDAAPLFGTGTDYTAAQRDADLATVSNYLHPTVQGPRDYNAYNAATQRLDHHYIGGLTVPGKDTDVVRTGPGYTGVQAADDLYTSGLTGPLTPYQDKQRQQALDRLKPYFYDVNAQHRDQVFAQWATPELCLVPGAATPPSYDPPDREKLIQQLVADGIPNGNPRPTWKQADAYVTAQTNDAVARLNTAGIAIDPAIAAQYMNQPMAADPHYPNRLEPLLHVNLPSDDRIVSAFEKAFGDNVDSIPALAGINGLNQMGQSWKDLGVATESILAVAPVTSGLADLLARANGGHLPGMSGPYQPYQNAADMAKGFTDWNDFRHGDIESGIGTLVGNLAGGAVTGAVTDGLGGVAGAAARAAKAGILDSATADTVVTAAGQAANRIRSGLADSIEPDHYPTIDRTGNNAGAAKGKPDDPDSIRQRIADGIRGSGAAAADPAANPLVDQPEAREPSPTGSAARDSGDADPDVPRLVTYTQDADGMWHAIDRDGNPHDLRPGVRPIVDKNGTTRWYDSKRTDADGNPLRPTNTSMPEWAAKKKSSIIDAPEYRGDPTSMSPFPESFRDKRAGIDAQQNTDIATRKNIEKGINPIIDRMTIKGEDGNPRKVTIDDLSKTKLDDTIAKLKNSGSYSGTQVNKLQNLAKDLTAIKGAITDRSEERGQLGGDFYTQVENLKTIYEGKGPLNPDRVAIRTMPDGTKRVVLIEEKGGGYPQLGTRDVDGLNAQQGSAAYGRNEFLRKDSKALAALRAHDPELADSLLAGDTDFEYVLVETKPGANTITVTPFEPGRGNDSISHTLRWIQPRPPPRR